jgi:hypothetical protein
MHPTNITAPPQAPRPKVRIVRCRRRRRAGAVFHARMLLRSLRRFCMGATEAALMAGAAIYLIGTGLLAIALLIGVLVAGVYQLFQH